MTNMKKVLKCADKSTSAAIYCLKKTVMRLHVLSSETPEDNFITSGANIILG